jgi:hypothetical protein
MSGITGAAVKVGRTRRGLLPSGRLLTPEVWARRHRGIVWLLWLHVAGIAVYALAHGNGLAHSLEEASLVAVVALPAAYPAIGRRARSAAASCSRPAPPTWSTRGSASTRRSRSAGWEGLARTDPLTGVPNRRVWEEELPRELERARRTGAGVCLAMIDLDDCKAYNDRFGHQAGDLVLKRAATAWRGRPGPVHGQGREPQPPRPRLLILGTPEPDPPPAGPPVGSVAVPGNCGFGAVHSPAG